MKVLIFANFGMGLYKFRKELLDELIMQGYEVFISLPNDEYVLLLENIGCRYIESKVDRRGKNPIYDMKLLVSYVNIINKIKPDVVLTYTIKPNVYGGIACRITQKKYLSNVTGLGTAIENRGIIQKITLVLYKLGLKKAKCVFFQNEANREFFLTKGIISDNSKIIPGSGVNLEQYQLKKYPPNGKIRILFIGRIMKAKGIDELLEAAKQIKTMNRDVEFHIIGFCEEEYSDELRKLNDDGIICYHGQQNDVNKFIEKAHAILLPSHHEGMSNVLLESAAVGRPIIASNIAGCKETFDEGVSGIGFEAKSVKALVEAIQRFLDLPYNDKKRMGIAGRYKMEQEYNREIVIDAYLKQIGR